MKEPPKPGAMRYSLTLHDQKRNTIMTIQLEEKKLELDGKTYTLHVNMCVLDRVQEAHNGNLKELMDQSVNSVSTEVMACMLNDWAEDMGWDEHWSDKDVKKRFSLAALKELDVFGMFIRAITPSNVYTAEKPKMPENGSSGN